jgi:hypothetical protein
MGDQRHQLATLLARLQSPDAGTPVRLEAATLAARLALHSGDPSLADVAESLAVPPEGQDAATETDARIRCIARATRRAIALARRNGAPSPGVLARSLSDDADRVAASAQTELGDGRADLARQLARIGLSRHPGHTRLTRVLAEIDAA